MTYHKLLEGCQKSDYNFLLNDIAKVTEEEISKAKEECNKEVKEATDLKN